jgi:hypothetical protein
MGFFDLLKKKAQSEDIKKSKILLAMPMFNDGESFEFEKVADYLKEHWGISVSDIHGEDETIAFSIQGETIVLAKMPFQIPWRDIQGTAEYTYNWMTAEKDLANHNSHAIVSIISSVNKEIDRFGIMTKVLSSIIATTNCLGVYQGQESLLIPRQQYLDSAEVLKSDEFPIDLWIYIGLSTGESGNSAYTYGLSSFEKCEMEFVNVILDLEDIHTFLINICAYVISNDITFKSGETLGYTAEQKIKITKSKGIFVDGQTLKFEF